MEEAEVQGGGRAQEAEGEAGQEEGNQVKREIHIEVTVHSKLELSFWLFSKFKVWALFSNPSLLSIDYVL